MTIARVRVTDEPPKAAKLIGEELITRPKFRSGFKKQVFRSHIEEGRLARQQGLPINDICVRLLRDPDAKASWLMGWHMKDDEIEAAAELQAAKIRRRK